MCWVVFINDHVFHEQECTQLLKSVHNSRSNYFSTPASSEQQTSTRDVDSIS